MGRQKLIKVGASVFAVAFVLAGLWMVFRDSGFVRVHKATVTGLTGPRADRIRAAALSQTTMDVDENALIEAGSGQPPIAGIDVSTSFPDQMKIHVRLFKPVAAVSSGAGSPVAVSADGTVLRGVSTNGLPRVEGIAGAGSVRTAGAGEVIKVLAGAPAELLARITKASFDRKRGVVVVMRNGPRVYFGSVSEVEAKWAALSRVLADPASSGASYIDVTVPRRPAVGGVQGGVVGGVDPADPNQPIGADNGGGSPDQATTDTSQADPSNTQ